MSKQFTEALKAEIADLSRQLHADPRYIKVRELERVMALYVSTHRDAPRREATAPSSSRPFASGVSATILDVAKEVLSGLTEPTPTKAIMGVLDERGVQIGGTVPQNSVSSILSKSTDFICHGRSGWTLVNGDDSEKTGDERSDAKSSPALSDRRPDQPMEPRA